MRQDSNRLVNRSFSLREKEIAKLRKWSNFLKSKGIKQNSLSFIVGALVYDRLPENPEESISSFKDAFHNFEKARTTEFEKFE